MDLAAADLTSLGDLIRARAALSADRPFLTFEGQTLTFGEVDAVTDALADAVHSLGVGEGDRVAIMLRNGLDFPVIWLAIVKLGAVAVPINPQLRKHDLGHLLADSRPTLAVAESDLVNTVAAGSHCQVRTPDSLRRAHCAVGDRPVADVRRTAVANLQYTSGTTGLPKACMLTHDYWLRLGELARSFGDIGESDIALTAAPFSYIDPQWNVVLALLAGSELVVLPRFNGRDFWTALTQSRATFCYLVGTMAMLLLKDAALGSSSHALRLVVCSGIPAQLHSRLEELLGVPWREAYGSTETGLDLVMPLAERGSVGSGSLGLPVPGKAVAVRVGDRAAAVGEVGELCVSGVPMMQGYWPQCGAGIGEDGWRRTGDLGYADQNGWFYLVGRTKDMIRRGGQNISAAEVEELVISHPDVAAAAAVAVSDELMGEEVKLYVELLPAHLLAAADLLDFARDRLASFKVPRYVQFVAELPRTPSERVAKGELGRLDDPAMTFDSRSAVTTARG